MEKQREAKRVEEIRKKMDDERGGILKGGVSSTGLDRDDESEDEGSSSDDEEESEDESSSDEEEEESEGEGDNEADVKEEL